MLEIKRIDAANNNNSNDSKKRDWFNDENADKRAG